MDESDDSRLVLVDVVVFLPPRLLLALSPLLLLLLALCTESIVSTEGDCWTVRRLVLPC